MRVRCASCDERWLVHAAREEQFCPGCGATGHWIAEVLPSFSPPTAQKGTG